MFRQIEVELTPDGQGELDWVVEQLTEAGAVVDNQPKIAIALGSDGLASADDIPPIYGRALLGDVVQASIGEAMDKILENDYRLRLDPRPSFPTTCTTAGSLPGGCAGTSRRWVRCWIPTGRTHIRAQLQWLGGGLREGARCRRAGQSSVGRPGGLPRRRSRESMSSNSALPTNGGCRVPAARRGFGQPSDIWITSSISCTPLASGHTVRSWRTRGGIPLTPRATDPARRALPPLLRKAWRALHRRVKHAGRHPSDVELHGIRIAAKQVRYAVDMATPVIGEPARLTAAAAWQLQTVLGNHQDAVVAVQWLRCQGLAGSSAAGFAAGLLTAQQYGRQEELRCQWRSTWDGLDKKVVRGWVS